MTKFAEQHTHKMTNSCPTFKFELTGFNLTYLLKLSSFIWGKNPARTDVGSGIINDVINTTSGVLLMLN